MPLELFSPCCVEQLNNKKKYKQLITHRNLYELLKQSNICMKI